MNCMFTSLVMTHTNMSFLKFISDIETWLKHPEISACRFERGLRKTFNSGIYIKPEVI